jgi:hypothetical protein
MVLRNTLRNRSRTILTVGIVMLGMALLFSFLSVERSIDRTMGKTAAVGRLVVQEQFRG